VIRSALERCDRNGAYDREPGASDLELAWGGRDHPPARHHPRHRPDHRQPHFRFRPLPLRPPVRSVARPHATRPRRRQGALGWNQQDGRRLPAAAPRRRRDGRAPHGSPARDRRRLGAGLTRAEDAEGCRRRPGQLDRAHSLGADGPAGVPHAAGGLRSTVVGRAGRRRRCESGETR
jgi:hypothetical protein